MDQLAANFLSECLFQDDSVNRESWLVWEELNSLVTKVEESGRGLGNISIPFQQLKLLLDSRFSWSEQLKMRFSAMESMGEFVIWRCLIYQTQKINNVKLAADFSRNGMRHFRNKELNPIFSGLSKFNESLSLMKEVPDRCAAIRLILSNADGSVNGLKGKNLVQASQQFRNILVDVLANPSKHAKKTKERISDVESWYQLKTYMADLVNDGTPSFDLEEALKKSWQFKMLIEYGPDPTKVDRFIRENYPPSA